MNTKLASIVLAGTMFTAGTIAGLTVKNFNGTEALSTVETSISNFDTAAKEYVNLAEEVSVLANNQNTNINELVNKVNELRGMKETLESRRDALLQDLNKSNSANDLLANDVATLKNENIQLNNTVDQLKGLLNQANQQVEKANQEVEALEKATEGKLDTNIFDKSKLNKPESIDVNGALTPDSIRPESTNSEIEN